VKIPKSIEVGKKKYTIKQTPKMSIKGVMGAINYKENQILIATHSNVRGVRFKREEVYDTFWHELTHAILKDMGSRLEADEKFVTGFSERLTKAILSARFK
jgi:hypothetical protein